MLLTLIEAWFSENPTGQILMGENYSPSGGNAYNDGGVLYRHKLRTRPVNGVQFQFGLIIPTRVGKYSPTWHALRVLVLPLCLLVALAVALTSG